MSTTSIKISQLNVYPTTITGSDYIPLNRSSSLTTYRAAVSQLQTFLSTGSYSGSFIGTLTGTSSVALIAVTASYVTASNIAGSVVSSSYALTASYAKNSATVLNGAGTVNYIPVWDGNIVLGNSDIYYSGISSSYTIDNANLEITVTSSFIDVRSTNSSSIMLRGNTSRDDGWKLSVNTKYSATSSLDTTRGILDLITYSGSNNLASIQPVNLGNSNEIVTLRTVSNGFYFWPLYTTQSVCRDGTLNVGVDSASTLNTESRVRIDVFSGSNASNPKVNHLGKAIEVRYGSSSMITTFAVSSSGQVVASGYSGSSSGEVAFYGSSSYALTSSKLNYLSAAGGALPSVGTAVNIIHNNGTPLPYAAWRLRCVNSTTVEGVSFSAGDEIDISYFQAGTSVLYSSSFMPINNSVSCSVRYMVTPHSMTTSDWNLKLYYSL